MDKDKITKKIKKALDEYNSLSYKLFIENKGVSKEDLKRLDKLEHLISDYADQLEKTIVPNGIVSVRLV